ncbi:MAG: hypothetical protein AVDCRST_MAG38-2865, partial [uncultured Solirubrobacteraceae bacterium]
ATQRPAPADPSRRAGPAAAPARAAVADAPGGRRRRLRL